MMGLKLIHVSKRGPWCLKRKHGLLYNYQSKALVSSKYQQYISMYLLFPSHDNVIKRKYFPRCWPFVRGMHRWPLDSSHKGQWREALMFSLICAWTNGWVNNRDAGDSRRYRAHFDVAVMVLSLSEFKQIVCCVDNTDKNKDAFIPMSEFRLER